MSAVVAPLLLLAAGALVWWYARSAAPGVSLDSRAVVLRGAPGAAVGRAAYRLLPTSMRDALSRRAALAGDPSAYPLVGHKLVGAAVGVGLAGVSLARGAGPLSWVFVLLCLYSAWSLPDVLAVGRGRRRQLQVRRDLADVTDQIAVCMRAGLGFDAALARVAGANRGPLGEELGRVIHDVSLGRSRREALDGLLGRTDVAELRQLVNAVNQSSRYGVSVADTLVLQAAELRDKRRQWAEEQATKVPVKLLFPLVFCIMPALFIVLLGPAALRVAGGGLGG